jgi:hypothetical protein
MTLTTSHAQHARPRARSLSRSGRCQGGQVLGRRGDGAVGRWGGRKPLSPSVRSRAPRSCSSGSVEVATALCTELRPRRHHPGANAVRPNSPAQPLKAFARVAKFESPLERSFSCPPVLTPSFRSLVITQPAILPASRLALARGMPSSVITLTNLPRMIGELRGASWPGSSRWHRAPNRCYSSRMPPLARQQHDRQNVRSPHHQGAYRPFEQPRQPSILSTRTVGPAHGAAVGDRLTDASVASAEASRSSSAARANTSWICSRALNSGSFLLELAPKPARRVGRTTLIHGASPVRTAAQARRGRRARRGASTV